MSPERKKSKGQDEQSASIPGRFSYSGLERVIHEKARLGILSSLAVHKEGLLFNDLKEVCALTDGNLSRHLTVLTEADLVEAWKGQQGARTQTLYRLTVHGRKQFSEYIDLLERIVSDAKLELDTPHTHQQLREGWSSS